MSNSQQSPVVIHRAGPGMFSCAVKLPYPLVSKSNFRMGKGSWGDVAAFENILNMDISASLPDVWMPDEGLGVVVCIISGGRYDVGNFDKSILDAMEGVVYLNDSEVVAESVYRNSSLQGFVVGFAQVSDGMDVREVLRFCEDTSFEAVSASESSVS